MVSNYCFKITNKQQRLGKDKTFFIRTYGCQANERDSEIIKAILLKIGFKEIKDFNKNVDLVILNTCAIRQNAENKVFGLLEQLKKKKETRKIKYFGICGCVAQQPQMIKKLKAKIPNIDFFMGTNNIIDLPHILEMVMLKDKQVSCIDKMKSTLVENWPNYRETRHKALVNIMYGCNHYCSYCIVPYVRGPIRSRAKENILNEVKCLIKNGCKEITLLGQNVNSYGIDLKQNYTFANLLEDVAKTKIPRIRYATSNPWNFTKEIIDVMAKYKNIMPYIHLPMQSGDETILKLMNRTMKVKDFIALIKYARKKIPCLTVSTDLIVGFPNETNKQFRKTLRLYKKIKFDNAYTFIYSARPYTPASKIVDKVALKTKQKRLTKLNKLVKKYSKWNNNKYITNVVQVLVDGQSKTNKNIFTGYSHNWKVVNFAGQAKIGDIVNVKITSSSLFSLNGEKISC